jgi:hypothetical protein
MFWRAAQIGVVVLAGSIATPAQTELPRQLNGFINDYTLVTFLDAAQAHFGAQALSGIVRNRNVEDSDEQ